MQRFIALTRSMDGKTIYVNTTHIMSVSPAGFDVEYGAFLDLVGFMDDEHIHVAETVHKVMEMINGENERRKL